MKRRNDLDICADMLEVAKKGAKKTRLVYRANLNFKIVEKYLKRLLSGDLLRFDASDRNYTTTKKGRAFLGTYHTLIFTQNNVEALDLVEA